MKVLCVRIAATYGFVINVEAAYCCRASAFRPGIPIPPCAGSRVNSSRNSSGRGSVWLKRTGRKLSLIASSVGSTYTSKESIVRIKYANFDLLPREI